MSGKDISETIDAAAAAGRILGELHRELMVFSRKYRLTENLSLIGFDWFANYFYTGDVFTSDWLDVPVGQTDESYLSNIRENLPFLRDTRSQISAWLAGQQKAGTLTECTVHGDYYQRNILWDGTAITAVLDWDEVNTSWLEYEVANAVWEFSLQDDTMMMDQEIVHAFIDGYNSISVLPSLTGHVLKQLVGLRRLVEIQLDLYELRKEGPHDLAYCAGNIRGLRLLDSGAL
jgi:Ser/Thr protein kinase RdoA (MazF antagonist)